MSLYVCASVFIFYFVLYILNSLFDITIVVVVVVVYAGEPGG